MTNFEDAPVWCSPLLLLSPDQILEQYHACLHNNVNGRSDLVGFSSQGGVAEVTIKMHSGVPGECSSNESLRIVQSTTDSHWRLQLEHNPLCISIGVNKHVDRRKQLSRSDSFQLPVSAVEVTIKMHSGVSGRYTFQGEPRRYTFDDRLSLELVFYGIPLCIFIAVRVGDIRAGSSARNKSTRQRV